MKTFLVTGGAGFIGSNFIQFMLRDHRDIRIVNLDALTYAGSLENLAGAAQDSRCHFVRGDIRDSAVVDGLFDLYGFDTVVNFAAETHVDRSIADPGVFMRTNAVGAQNLLDAARRHWCADPGDKYCRAYREGVRFLQVSTDEVYGALGPGGLHTEDAPLSPNSPYAAAKAAADLAAHAYHVTFGLPVNVTRCSNNYGPRQHPEKLIPLMIHNCMAGRPLPVYGDGLQVRDWLYVEDHCRAIDAVLQKGIPGEVYNIGGSNERTNIEIVRLILARTGRGESLVTHVKDRPGHDRRYAVDNTKITSALGWSPLYTFEEGMEKTIGWYLNNAAWMERATGGAYRAYYDSMYGADAKTGTQSQ